MFGTAAHQAFGVGSGTLRLPIPTNCPPGLAAMLEACWSRDYHLRPSFREVRVTRTRPTHEMRGRVGRLTALAGSALSFVR